jgi:hypothetical protein
VLQQQLKDSKEHAAQLEAENARLRTLSLKEQPPTTLHQPPTATAVKQEPSDRTSASSVGGADSGAGGGVGTCGATGCSPQTASGVPSEGTDPAVAKQASSSSTPPGGARTSNNVSPRPVTAATTTLSPKAKTASPQCQASPGLPKRTTDVEGGPKGRTGVEVVNNDQHDCSLAAGADTSDLRSDQACDSLPRTAQPTTPTQSHDSVPASREDCKAEVKVEPSLASASPVRNGMVDGVAIPAGHSQG